MSAQLHLTTRRIVTKCFILIGTVELTTNMPSEGRSSEFYHIVTDKVLTPLLRRLDPEDAHNLALTFIQKSLSPRYRPNTLESTQIINLSSTPFSYHPKFTFSNCIGLAAGFDKDGIAISGLFELGFGCVEIGSVTPFPQTGSHKPRLYRLVEDKGIINRFGFNSVGLDRVLKNIQKYRDSLSQNTVKEYPTWIPHNVLQVWNTIQPYVPKFSSSYLINNTPKLGINLGINKSSSNPLEDYQKGIQTLGPHADYLVINVSSPNTKGLRNLQQIDSLRKLLTVAKNERNQLQSNTSDNLPPLLVKISPDLTHEQIKDIATVVMECQIDGVVVSNTSNQRPSSLKSKYANEVGGLSGKPIKELSTACIRTLYQLTNGDIAIIGIGGVGSGQDAYEKLTAGASMVQMYSSMVYNGVGSVSRVRKELAEVMKMHGFTNVHDVIGLDHSDIYWKKKLERAKLNRVKKGVY